VARELASVHDVQRDRNGALRRAIDRAGDDDALEHAGAPSGHGARRRPTRREYDAIAVGDDGLDGGPLEQRREHNARRY